MTRIKLSAHPLPGPALVGQARHARQAMADRNATMQLAGDRGKHVKAKPEDASRTA